MIKYPNPIRLLSEERNQWFVNFSEKLNIPIHILTSIRDTQIGQLIFAIENIRLKKIKEGEDPGPKILDGESMITFVPLFQLMDKLQKFFEHDDVKLKFNEVFNLDPDQNYLSKFDKIRKNSNEWFISLDFDRLNEIYISAFEFLKCSLVDNLSTKLKIDPLEKIKEIDADLYNLITTFYDPQIHEAIKNKDTKLTDNQTVIFNDNSDKKIELQFNDYESRINLLYAFILEILRKEELNDEYNFQFPNIEILLTLEMLIMIPKPDKSILSLVKSHLESLKNSTETLKEFWDILYQSYYSFCYLVDGNQRLLPKMMKNWDKNFKDLFRLFWSKSFKLDNDTNDYNNISYELVCVIWTHFRLVQAQMQQLNQQHQNHYHQHPIYRYVTRIERTFWNQGKTPLNNKIDNKYMFWFNYANIVNFEVRNKSDSKLIFDNLNNLYSNYKILKSKKSKETFDIMQIDEHNLLQSILSYGLESDEKSIYPTLTKYLNKFEKFIQKLKDHKSDFQIDLKEESKTIKVIKEMLAAKIQN